MAGPVGDAVSSAITTSGSESLFNVETTMKEIAFGSVCEFEPLSSASHAFAGGRDGGRTLRIPVRLGKSSTSGAAPRSDRFYQCDRFAF